MGKRLNSPQYLAILEQFYGHEADIGWFKILAQKPEQKDKTKKASPPYLFG